MFSLHTQSFEESSQNSGCIVFVDDVDERIPVAPQFQHVPEMVQGQTWLQKALEISCSNSHAFLPPKKKSIHRVQSSRSILTAPSMSSGRLPCRLWSGRWYDQTWGVWMPGGADLELPAFGPFGWWKLDKVGRFMNLIDLYSFFSWQWWYIY